MRAIFLLQPLHEFLEPLCFVGRAFRRIEPERPC
ncbi:hypothetical protein VP150E351_P0201 [Vibrio phage 150E35-1]|nr:hypothetical protein VP150E351_P0201 [Vibrio phage 150E35-1]